MIKVYIIKLNEHKNDRPHSIVNNKASIILSKLISFIVQVFNEKISL